MTHTRMTTSTVAVVIPKTVVLPGPTSTVTEQVGVNVTRFSTRYISQPATPTVVTLQKSSNGTTQVDFTTMTIPKTGPAPLPSSREDISTSGVRSGPDCPGDSSLCPTPPPESSDSTHGSEPADATDIRPKPTAGKSRGQPVPASRPAEPHDPIAQSSTQHVPPDLETEGPPDILLSPIATAIAFPTSAALATCPPAWLRVMALLVALRATRQ